MIVPRPVRLEVLGGLGAAAGREPDLELLPFGPPEGYRLDTAGPAPRIRAQDAAGVAYALTTLGQLSVDAGRLPAVVVEDHPRYPWRGVMLDTVAEFVPVPSVLAWLDALAALKLNRLHLRLAGAQACRLELDAWPGAHADERYTRDDLRELLAHAEARHIVIVPGIELPDGMNAGLAPGDELASRAADVVRELARLVPGEWVHLSGAPEAVEAAASAAVQLGQQVVGWTEAGAARLPAGSIGQHRGPLLAGGPAAASHGAELRELVGRGGWALLSPLDVARLDAASDAGQAEREPVVWDPAEVIAGIGEDRIVGVEALIDAAALDSAREAVLPQVRALAEVMWSPRRRAESTPSS